MALSLGVKENARIKVGEQTVAVLEIRAHNDIYVEVTTPIPGTDFAGAKCHTVTDQERVEIAPGVYLQAGAQKGKGSSQYTRLAFTAPMSVRIERLDRAA